jgi:hypothetical protein
MTRVTIGLTLAALVVLFVAYAKGVSVIHGGDVLSHMYWATAALVMVALANFIAVAHLARAERMLQQFRALCEKHGVPFEGLE